MAFEYPTNVTNLAEYFRYSNVVTGDLFGALMLLAIFIILIARMKDYPSSKAFASAAFVTALVAVFFRVIRIISDFVLIVAIFLVVVSIIVLQRDEA